MDYQHSDNAFCFSEEQNIRPTTVYCLTEQKFKDFFIKTTFLGLDHNQKNTWKYRRFEICTAPPHTRFHSPHSDRLGRVA